MTFRLSCLAAALVTLTVAAPINGQYTASAVPPATPEARAVHVLNRLTFGPRPGDVDRVTRMGVDRWIEDQLRPESIDDRGAATALAGCPHWTEPVEAAMAKLPSGVRMVSIVPPAARPTDTSKAPARVEAAIMRQTAARMVRVRIAGRGVTVSRRDTLSRQVSEDTNYVSNNELVACRLARGEGSDQQLLEVMTDFWENHFSVHGATFPSRGSFLEWDRAVIRPNALGRFRDLLGAVSRSPAMLTYLDNSVSTADTSHMTLAEYTRAGAIGATPLAGPRIGKGLNENYGRELLELHTLGAGGGYTQTDVIEVSRAFTGWTHSLRPRPGVRVALSVNTSDVPATFVFDSATHDADPKVVLGHTLAAGRGMEDAEQVLDILARHPSTARFIARKLAVRFVSDNPPEALIERAAATFLRTDGNIREVVRTIVTSPEFLSSDVHGAKVKSPLELVLSMRRSLGAPIDTLGEAIDLLITLDQPPLGRVAPDGWPETASPWLNFGTMMARLELATRVADGKIKSIPVESWPEWGKLADKPFATQVDGVIRTLLNGQASPDTRAAMSAVRPRGEMDDPATRALMLRELIGLALGSPEFQRQ